MCKSWEYRRIQTALMLVRIQSAVVKMFHLKFVVVVVVFNFYDQ